MSILMQQSDGILQHIYDQIFTFKKGSRLIYIKQKIKIEDIFIFSELLTSLGDYIIQENLIDTNNKLIVICDDFLSFALCCRMIHIQQIETRILHDIEPLSLQISQPLQPLNTIGQYKKCQILPKLQSVKTNSRNRYRIKIEFHKFLIHTKLGNVIQTLYTAYSLPAIWSVLLQHLHDNSTRIFDVRTEGIYNIENDPLAYFFGCKGFHATQLLSFLTPFLESKGKPLNYQDFIGPEKINESKVFYRLLFSATTFNPTLTMDKIFPICEITADCKSKKRKFLDEDDTLTLKIEDLNDLDHMDPFFDEVSYNDLIVSLPSTSSSSGNQSLT